jgi:predicted esterase
VLAWAGCACLAAVGPRVAAADTPPSDDLDQHDLVVGGDPRLARRALVLVPKHLKPGDELPLLILLHGLGETGNELLGIHAWGERYGLVRAYERLRRPPVTRTRPRRPYLTDARIQQLGVSLANRPFRGLILACPVTPNPYRLLPAERTLDRYAEWIEGSLIPAVRRVAPVMSGPHACGLDGCSLGGYVGMEVFLRRPQLFATFGAVQGAYSVPRAIRYARRLAATIQRVGPRPIHLETSSQDPYRRANQAMSRTLEELGVPHVLNIPPGPHDQPWLQEVGTLEMLLWHDRQLGARGEPPA